MHNTERQIDAVSALMSASRKRRRERDACVNYDNGMRASSECKRAQHEPPRATAAADIAGSGN